MSIQHTRIVKPDGYVVDLTLTITPLDRPMTDIEHQPIEPGPNVYRVSIVGDLLPSTRHRNPVASGQIINEVPDDNPIKALWQRWHLNDMRGACAHMTGLPPLATHWGAEYGKQMKARLAYECEAGSGYTYGHAWLFEPVPYSIIHELRGLFGAWEQ